MTSQTACSTPRLIFIAFQVYIIRFRTRLRPHNTSRNKPECGTNPALHHLSRRKRRLQYVRPVDILDFICINFWSEMKVMGDSEYVPWAKFQENIHAFIRTILKQQAMASTKIVLITPPPIGIPAPILDHELLPAEIEDKNMGKRGYPPFKTYMSKKRYAEGIMKIAGEYEETGRVVGLDFWRAIISALLEEGKTQGTGKGEAENEFDEDMPPGCGLVGAKTFGLGWFTDGLHLNVKGYNVLSEALLKTITGKWPELAPDKL